MHQLAQLTVGHHPCKDNAAWRFFEHVLSPDMLAPKQAALLMCTSLQNQHASNLQSLIKPQQHQSCSCSVETVLLSLIISHSRVLANLQAPLASMQTQAHNSWQALPRSLTAPTALFPRKPLHSKLSCAGKPAPAGKHMETPAL